MSRLAWLSVLGLLSACGGNGGTGGGDGDGGPGGGATVLYDDVHPGSCVSERGCEGFEVASACACVTTPLELDEFATNQVGCWQLPTEGDVPRTPEIDYCNASGGDGAPDLGCMMPESFRAPGESMAVDVYGVVDVFGNGGDSDQITVEIYREGADGELGAMVGSASISSITSPCAEEEAEIDNDMVVGMRQLGFYHIAGVPTETPLIVKTSGAPDFWKDLYSYNVYIHNEEVATDAPAADACAETPTGPRFEYRARTLSRSDYVSIPLTAGVPAGIPNGRGAVAGEVHDCADVRLEYAQVGVSPRPQTLVYFNDNPSNPLPQMGRTEGTSRLGLYAALDLEPGPVDVSAVGRVGGELVSLGWYRVQVFANSVTAVTIRGLRPHQVPAE